MLQEVVVTPTQPAPMNFSLRLASLLLTFIAAIIPQYAGLAQGSLTPPGSPAPLFKTLSQVEPRFPISDFGTNLTVSGSYYLTANLFSGTNAGDAITIRTNMHDMTIDLNGFSIISTNPPGADSPVGIRISEATNIVIRNGQFSGFDSAVRAEGKFFGIVVDNIHSQHCHRAGIEADGVAGNPIQTVTIRNCIVDKVDSTGEATDVSADGMVLLNCTAMVQNCVVRDITPAGAGLGTGINVATCTNTFIDNNFISHAPIGLNSSGTGTRFYYRNNLQMGCGTGYSISGGVDRGGNF